MNAKPKPRTLADIFFQVVDRNQSRVMLFERDSVWHEISSSGLYQRVMGVVQALRLPRYFARRPRRHSRRKPPGVGDCRLCHSPRRRCHRTHLRHSHRASRFLFSSVTRARRQPLSPPPHSLPSSGPFKPKTSIETIILMDEPAPEAEAVSMSALMEAGPKQRVPELDALANQITPDDLATADLHQRHHRHSQGCHAHARQYCVESLRFARRVRLRAQR